MTSYPPGPKASFLLGHLPGLRREQMRFLQRCARDYGDFVPLRLGPTRAFLLHHPDFLEQVFVADYRKFNRGLGATRNRLFFGDGLITSEGDAWRRQRTRMQPAFHRERIVTYAETMAVCTEAKIAAWRNGETRDVHREMTELALQMRL